MKTARTVGLLLVGILVGMLITSFDGRGSLQAELRAQDRSTRLKVKHDYNVGGDILKLVSDPKSGGCWLYAVAFGEGTRPASVALAVAPKETCE